MFEKCKRARLEMGSVALWNDLDRKRRKSRFKELRLCTNGFFVRAFLLFVGLLLNLLNEVLLIHIPYIPSERHLVTLRVSEQRNRNRNYT
jgi:hypothetical protein